MKIASFIVPAHPSPMDWESEDSPQTFSKILLRWVLHFLLGCFFGLPLALGGFFLVSMAPNVNLLKAGFLCFLFFSAPVGLFFWLLGLYRRGQLLYDFLQFLGISTRIR
jgi:hypothetical protein